MSNNSSDDFWGWVIGIGLAVVGIMWLFDAGPFEKEYTPTYPVQSYGTYNPSFGGNNKVAVSVSVNQCNGLGVCSCKTYKGYKIAGTNNYVGKCQNFIYGHTCGHSPREHGL